MNKYLSTYFLAIMVSAMLNVGCDAPAGPEGPIGSQGEQGLVGMAGEDGSIIYAGNGTPNAGTGEEGDYYLDQNTGALHGPKSSDGWNDNPIIVLMGENGADGRDGENGADGRDGEDGADGRDGEDGIDGQDGEDGNRTHSGEGTPDEELGNPGDFYLDKINYELYGPKTSVVPIGSASLWGNPINLKGADGNANVTRYIFPGADLSSVGKFALRYIPGIESETEVRSSAWLVYVVMRDNTGIQGPMFGYHSVPGFGGGLDQMDLFQGYYINTKQLYFHISLKVDDPSLSNGYQIYEEIEIIRIRAGNTIDQRKHAGEISIIPKDLDTSNYAAVAKYYGF